MTKDQFLALVQKHAQGEASREERERLEEYYDRLQHGGKELGWDLSKEEETKLRIWRRISSGMQLRARSKRKSGYMLRIAASFLLIAGAGVVFYFLWNQDVEVEQITVVTQQDQRKTITLPDGTLVTLNRGSRVTYPANFTTVKREVTLQGEAFFEVKREEQRPFEVRTDNLTTTVLGTSFNARDFPGENADVTVISGKVQVQHGEQAILVTRDQQVLFNVQTKSLTRHEVEAAYVQAWTRKELQFELIPFAEVLARLERWYHVEIEIVEKPAHLVNPCMIKATYENQGLGYILKGLQNLVDFEYEVLENGKISVKHRGCRE